jgi:hypothetical protein
VYVVALSACAGHRSAIERAELKNILGQSGSHGVTGVSCDRRGDPFTLRGVTYTGYMCTVRGGRLDGANEAAWWDGTRLYAYCNDLPSKAQNALCFD